MNSRKLWISLIIAFVLFGVAGGYFLYQKFLGPGKNGAAQPLQPVSAEMQDLVRVRMSFPVENRLAVMERNVPRRMKQTAMADAVVEEYFKGPGSGKAAAIPTGVKLLGTYRDSRQLLFIDLSDEFRRNFSGDAAAEYLLLKGLYDSVIANSGDVQDIKILVDGKELETLGGHFFLKYPLKDMVGSELREEKVVRPE